MCILLPQILQIQYNVYENSIPMAFFIEIIKKKTYYMFGSKKRLQIVKEILS